MNIKSYLSPKTKTMKSKIHGLGLFAVEPIKKGEIVGIKTGYIIDENVLKQLGGLKSGVGRAMLQIGDEFFVGPLAEEEIKDSMMYFNHSCDPNLGILGNVVTVAMRDVGAGEELTNDYAMWLNDNDYRLECRCGRTGCRHVIAGNDWKIPELQEKYKGYFSAYIQKKIEKSLRLLK